MTTEATRECHGIRGLPVPTGADATAFVASLFSAPEPVVEVAQDGSPSAPVLDPTPVGSVPDSTLADYPSRVMPSAHNEYILTSPMADSAAPGHSATPRYLILVALSAFIFGAGLAVGYGILGRPSNSGGPSAAVGPAAVPPTNSVANSRTSIGPAHTQEHANIAHRNESGDLSPTAGDDLSQPPAPLRSSRSRGIDALADRPVNREVPIGFARSENGLPAPRPPEIPVGPASSAVSLVVPETHTPIERPAEPAPPSDEVPGAVPALSGEIVPCQLVHSVQPVYPAKAKKLHVEGNVELRVVVAVDGSVQSVGLVSGPDLLVPAAMDATREFRYNPALLNGKPIETVQTVDLSFKLNH